jgi:hypothetical protein
MGCASGVRHRHDRHHHVHVRRRHDDHPRGDRHRGGDRHDGDHRDIDDRTNHDIPIHCRTKVRNKDQVLSK